MSNNKLITVADYLDSLPTEGRAIIEKIRESIVKNIPEGFVEEVSYGMIGYVVPHTIYQKGYHCDPSTGTFNLLCFLR